MKVQPERQIRITYYRTVLVMQAIANISLMLLKHFTVNIFWLEC